MADAPQTPSPSLNVPPAGESLDQLARLHRMSRTAGAGTSEYTAVNTLAVVALLIAVASALALVSSIFLLLALLGVVFAALAIHQIRSSNGTQTGLPLAILALVLSVGLTGVTGFRYVRAEQQKADDIRGIDDLAGRFGKLIADKKYAEAYALTDARFQEQVPLSDFESLFGEALASAPGFGPLVGVRTTKLFSIEADPDTGLRMAMGNALFDTQQKSGDGAIRTEMRYRNTGEEWKVFAIPQFFPPKAAPGAGAPGDPAGPPAS